MNNLSITQEYLLCALNPNGGLPIMRSTEINTCLVAGGILELLFSHTISIDEKKKATIQKDLDETQLHLKPLYLTIKNEKPMTINDLGAKYLFANNKLLNELVEALSQCMEKNQFISTKAGGLFHNKTILIPNQEKALRVIEKIRAELLEDGSIHDETIVLAALLQRSGLIKNYFSKYESQTLKVRLEEIKKSEAGSLIKEMVDYIDTVIAVVASIAGNAGI